jgi:glycosyltransferase involved in cell wall biosynthesis
VRDTSPGERSLRIGMILYGDLTYDSRVRREARSLAAAGFEVVIACLANADAADDLPPEVSVVVRPLVDASAQPGALNPFRARGASRVLALARGAAWFLHYVRALRSWGPAAAAACGEVDSWHAHDLTGLLALGSRLGRGTPVVYDVHDLVLESGTALRLPALARRLLQRYEKRLVRRVAAVVTVNRGLKAVIQHRYGPRSILVLHNYPDRWTPPVPRPTLIRDATGVPDGSPIILSHGLLGPYRGIEQLLDAIRLPGLESAHVVLLGFGSARSEYPVAADRMGIGSRVHLLDAVPPSDLLRWVASADVGAVLHPGRRLNDRNKTPNKLFECIAAGTPVVASDFPLMRDFVVGGPGGPLGVLCDPTSVDGVAAALRSLLDQDPTELQLMRARCTDAAQRRLNWEAEVGGLVNLHRELIGARA